MDKLPILKAFYGWMSNPQAMVQLIDTHPSFERFRTLDQYTGIREHDIMRMVANGFWSDARADLATYGILMAFRQKALNYAYWEGWVTAEDVLRLLNFLSTDPVVKDG